MADWVNKGSYKDLSDVIPGDPVSCLTPDSMHAGNQVWERNSMSAPGGASGDLGNNLGSAVVIHAPVIEAQDKTEPGDDGKPQPDDSWSAPPPSWKPTTVPDVIRTK